MTTNYIANPWQPATLQMSVGDREIRGNEISVLRVHSSPHLKKIQGHTLLVASPQCQPSPWRAARYRLANKGLGLTGTDDEGGAISGQLSMPSSEKGFSSTLPCGFLETSLENILLSHWNLSRPKYTRLNIIHTPAESIEAIKDVACTNPRFEFLTSCFSKAGGMFVSLLNKSKGFNL